MYPSYYHNILCLEFSKFVIPWFCEEDVFAPAGQGKHVPVEHSAQHNHLNRALEVSRFINLRIDTINRRRETYNLRTHEHPPPSGSIFMDT